MFLNHLSSVGPLTEENSQWKIRIFLLTSTKFSLSVRSTNFWPMLSGKNSSKKSSSFHRPKFSAPRMWPPANSYSYLASMILNDATCCQKGSFSLRPKDTSFELVMIRSCRHFLLNWAFPGLFFNILSFQYSWQLIMFFQALSFLKFLILTAMNRVCTEWPLKRYWDYFTLWILQCVWQEQLSREKYSF